MSSIDLSPFRAGERLALRPPEDLSVLQWAERYRVLDRDVEPGDLEVLWRKKVSAIAGDLEDGDPEGTTKGAPPATSKTS